MSKYIIEIAKEYEEYFKGVLICGIADGKFAVDVIAREDLEELNSDYINEHFSDLQDTAYQKGFDDGKNSIENGCKGCKYEDQHGYDEPCNKCMYAHASHYTPMPKDEICFGDEIVVNGERGVVVSHENEGSNAIWALLNGYRTPQIVHKNNYTKTGRRFDMAGIMEAVKNG